MLSIRPLVLHGATCLADTVVNIFQLLHHPTPTRNIQRHPHDQARDESSAWYGQDPPEENLSNLLPVDGLEVAVRQGTADHGSCDTLSGGHGQTELRCQEDCDRSSQFHRIATSWRVLCDSVAQVAHDVIAERLSCVCQFTGSSENRPLTYPEANAKA